MHKETSEWTIRMIADFGNRINIDAEYQRGKVWSKPQQALLIDSILRGFDIPKIYVRKLPPGSPHLFDVIDGKQRLTAIWQFLADEFPMLRGASEFPGLGDLGGKRWSELPRTAQDELQFANLTVSKIETTSDEDIRELFLRLQRGEPLNSAENRNAMAGPTRDFVAGSMVKHPLWVETGLKDRRFGIDEHAAILLALVRSDGPAAVKGADLQALYQADDFDPEGPEAKGALALLDSLLEIASCGEKEIRTRWGLVDLSICLMRLQQEEQSAAPKSICEFFKGFEARRREVASALSDLQTELVEKTLDDANTDENVKLPSIEPEMLAYHLAFSREGATGENVRTRSDIMYGKLIEYLARTT